MSYAYLFKYIIIGDTGKSLMCRSGADFAPAWRLQVGTGKNVDSFYSYSSRDAETRFCFLSTNINPRILTRNESIAFLV